MKADRKIYKGIEYIQFQELPAVQQEKLLVTADHDIFIKIMIDGKIISQCVQYKDYVNWFDNVFTVTRNEPVREVRTVENLSMKGTLVLNKA
jgi:hypothetical protein